jgi:uncharacterized protein (TIGR00255 family)
MTGFGRSVVDGDQASQGAQARWVIEVRSVNHRGFDLKIRSPDVDPGIEAEIARAVRSVVERGTVTVAVREEHTLPAGLDLGRVRELLSTLEKIRVEAGIAAPVDLGTVAAFLACDPNAGTSSAAGRADESAAAIRSGVGAALEELVATREREGAALAADLSARLERVGLLVTSIDEAAREVPVRFARRLKERLVSLHDAPGFDAGRVAQEIALMAERLDVSEELVRLRAHLEQLGLLTRSTTPVGRKLDFVLQEASREVNTIGSKAQDAAIGALVIDCKAELEKIREQAQNIE